MAVESAELAGRVRGRTQALVVLCVMQLMIILDGTVVTVALPTIQGDLGFSQAGLAWVMNSYPRSASSLLARMAASINCPPAAPTRSAVTNQRGLSPWAAIQW